VNAEQLRELAREALRQDAKAKQLTPSFDNGFIQELGCDCCAPFDSDTVAWTLGARTREPVLARALLLALDVVEAARGTIHHVECRCSTCKALRAFDHAGGGA
jgi:hypothetical protein